MSKDMFADTQQTPMVKAPRTPSLTPTRSVKRRTSVLKRTSNIPTQVPKRGELPWFSQSQPVLCEDYYHLRTRQVPLSNSTSDLWAQFGIYEPVKPISPGSSQEESEQRHLKDKKESRTLPSRCIALLELLLVMVVSAFLGAFCYAHFQHHFFSSDSCSSPLQIAQDVQTVGSVEQTIHSLRLENTMLRLSEELEHLKDRLNKIQENVGSEVISSPRKGILEELLTADLACAGNLGSVLATPDTTTVTDPVTFTVLRFLSFHVEMNHRPPQTTIEGLIQEVGDCWPFEGSRGRLVLKLHRRSLVSGVSVSHVPPSVSLSGDASSAPRLFQVLVHRQEDDLDNGEILGEFEYKTSGAWRQTFSFDSSSSTKEDFFDIIEFRFLKNHGNPNYTCVYRVHVHGRTA